MMTSDISQFNGLNPGAVLKWILKKRGINPKLSIKITELLVQDPAFFYAVTGIV
jgi:hypothetical protein